MLNANEKKELLKIAKDSIKCYLKGSKLELGEIKSSALQQRQGAFVTLHTKGGHLRGCIGRLESDEPLYKIVSEIAVESAFCDSRFEPVNEEELNDLIIEISILSPLKKIKDIKEIKLGTHGVLVRCGFRSGVFLPQVATETGWSLEEFLSNLCAGKAGLSCNAWKDKSTDIYIFSAEIISEEGGTLCD